MKRFFAEMDVPDLKEAEDLMDSFRSWLDIYARRRPSVTLVDRGIQDSPLESMRGLLLKLVYLTPQQVQELTELLGPCQTAVDLHNLLVTLQDLRESPNSGQPS